MMFWIVYDESQLALFIADADKEKPQTNFSAKQNCKHKVIPRN